ncbi:MAG: transcription antiterminator [Lachnospiraceae bacterium]|nr:transcription antiterminator [Lachnospiraceae bacterium]
MLNERQISLLSLLPQDEYITAEILAEKIGCSSKTIRNTIKELDDVLIKHGAGVESKHRGGYRLNVTDNEAFNKLLLADNTSIPDTQDDRVLYLMEKFLKSEDYIKTDDICEELFIAKKTLCANMKIVEKNFAKYDIILDRKPHYGIRAVGSEFNIRQCISNIVDKKAKLQRCEEIEDEDIAKIADILLKAVNEEEYSISDIALHNLVRHIYIAIHRIKSEKQIPSEVPYRDNISGSKALRIAERSVAEIEQIFDVKFDPVEVEYIAIHLAGKRNGNQGEENIVIDEEAADIVKEMLEEVYRCFRIDLRNDLELLMALGLHISPLMIRLKYGLHMENPLIDEVKEKYSLAFAMALQASTVLRRRFGKRVDENEIGYIAFSFALALERQRTSIAKKTALLICSSGACSAKLFAYKLKESFGEYIEEIRTGNLRTLETTDFSDIDYIFSTVEIKKSVPVPICNVSYFLKEEDIRETKKILKNGRGFDVQMYYPEDLFHTDLKIDSKDELLKFMCSDIESKRNVKGCLLDEVMMRESLAPTAFGNNVAMPHPNEPVTDESFVSVAVLHNPIKWSDEQEVSVVFLVAVKTTPDSNIQKFYDATAQVMLSEKDINELIKKKNYETLIELVKRRQE